MPFDPESPAGGPTERAVRVLLADDDRNHLRVVASQLESQGFVVIPCESGEEALSSLAEAAPDVLVTDLRMPGLGGLDLLEEVKRRAPELPVVFLTAYGTIDLAVEATKRGAFDFLTKPVEAAHLAHVIRRAHEVQELVRENRRLTEAVSDRFQFEGILGVSPKFREVIEKAKQLARVDVTVLLWGESGTGKELVARAIHFNSARARRPFVVVNCAAIPEDLLESELFGYRKGAFTGAVQDKKGKFEAAHTGTIFLDEIGELALAAQAKLLRVLQEREIDVVGDPRPRPVDVRVIAATNRNLEELMRAGRFREDLYYRLAVAALRLPPLRERREDIPLLANHFLEQCSRRMDRPFRLSPDALKALQAYSWPGNIRELQNVIEQAAVFAGEDVITAAALPATVQLRGGNQLAKLRLELPDEPISLEEIERELLLAALVKHGWNQTRAARYLGITRNTLVYRMQKFGIRHEESADSLDAAPPDAE
ncbi:MAG: sigma-54 dependent transcriptional regulator [Acidobacteriota bacterium]